MSGSGQPEQRAVDAGSLRVAIVAARWHTAITDAMVASAERACHDSGIARPTVLRVAGAFELSVVARAAAEHHDAVVALGVVIRGGTPHFEYVCSSATDGLTRAMLDTGKPIGFGLLTCDDEAQALDRAGLPDSSEDKGREATLAAIETALLLRSDAIVGSRHQPVGFGAR